MYRFILYGNKVIYPPPGSSTRVEENLVIRKTENGIVRVTE